MNSKRSVIPGIFTALNIFCGFLAIIKVTDGKIIQASWLIVFAAICDALDGKLARLTKSTSEFGIEFDSLADIVSFGVAPGILLYHVHFSNLGILGMIISFAPVVFGGFRLARFNIQTTGFKKTNFSGLPIPISAVSFASFIIFNYRFWDNMHLTRFLGPQIAFVCLLMVSTIEYDTFPRLTFRAGRKHLARVITMLSGFTALILFPHETCYPLCLFYIFWGIFRFIGRILSANNEENDDVDDRK